MHQNFSLGHESFKEPPWIIWQRFRLKCLVFCSGAQKINLSWRDKVGNNYYIHGIEVTKVVKSISKIRQTERKRRTGMKPSELVQISLIKERQTKRQKQSHGNSMVSRESSLLKQSKCIAMSKAAKRSERVSITSCDMEDISTDVSGAAVILD